ncbi:MAG: hypothetical protein PHE02_00465 [Lachnospiraceae bacterium]|nr:hypothetical protein [Lachnospiraceae bacterium]
MKDAKRPNGHLASFEYCGKHKKIRGNKKMPGKIISHMKNFIQDKICFILPIITAMLAVMLVCSYLIPKKVIDTYRTNTTEDEGDSERIQILEPGMKLTYHMNTGSRPMMGIHVGVAKNGNTYDTAAMICNVYTADGTLVSGNGYLLNQGEDVQYVYLPFQDYEKCRGDITMEFTYTLETDENVTAPGLLMNGKVLTDAHTELDGSKMDGNLKTIYIYTHDTYPLVYDLRILVVLFFAASMMVNYKKSGDNRENIGNYRNHKEEISNGKENNPIKKVSDKNETGNKRDADHCRKNEEESHE